MLLLLWLITLNFSWSTSRIIIASHFDPRKDNFPIIHKILQFLLMYIGYDNEERVIEYLQATSDGRLLAVEDVIVMLLYLSNDKFRDHCRYFSLFLTV